VGHAYTISYDEVLWQDGDVGLDPNTLSAVVEFEAMESEPGVFEPDKFLIRLTNTSTPSTPSDYPASVLLTGIAFNLGSGIDIISGFVEPTNLVGGTTPSDHWGYDNNPTSGYFQNPPEGVTTKYVDTAVSTMTAAVETIFTSPAPGSIGAYIDGPDYGVASNAYLSSIYYGSPPYAYFGSFMEVEVFLNQTVGDWDSFFGVIDSKDVVVAFGSPTAPVPEPATMLLLGFGLLGLAGFRRRFRKSKTIPNRTD